MTTIYLVYDDDAIEAEQAHASEADAVAHYERLRDAGKFSTLRKVTLQERGMTREQLACAIFNRQMFVAESETLMEVE